MYGYARARKVVWAGFGALAFASFMSWATLAFPPAPGWPHQAAYETVFGGTPRIVLASLVAYFCGEFCNSYVLAKMKLATGGPPALEPHDRLDDRRRGGGLGRSSTRSPSSACGETTSCVRVMVSNYLLKVLWEVVMTPFTYRIVNFLKRAESEDYFDRDTELHAVLAANGLADRRLAIRSGGSTRDPPRSVLHPTP